MGDLRSWKRTGGAGSVWSEWETSVLAPKKWEASAFIGGRHHWRIYVEEKRDGTFDVMVSKDGGVDRNWTLKTERELCAFFEGLNYFEAMLR